MTDAVMVALIAGVPATLTALGGLVVSVRTGWKVNAAVASAEIAATKAEALHVTTKEIKETSEKTAAQTDGHLTVLLERNKELHEMLTQAMSILSTQRVAAAVAQAQIPMPLVPTVPGVPQLRKTDLPAKDGNGDALHSDRRIGERRKPETPSKDGES